MGNLRLLLFFIAAFGGLSAPAANAKTKAPQPPPEYIQRLDEMEQKQKILERNLELKEEQLQKKDKEKPVIKASSEGFSISSADGNNEIRFRGLLQADARFYLDRDGVGNTNTLVLRRVRPFIEGKFFKRFEFRIMPDFADGKATLFDAYVDSVIYPELKIRIGKYKPPVGLERLESAQNLHFVERGFPTLLVPNRALGLMFQGQILEGVFEYQIGAFTGVPDGGNVDIGVLNSWEGAGRVFSHPFKKTSVEAAKGLGVGVSGSYGSVFGNVTSPNLPSYKTSGQNTFFSYRADALADGEQFRISPQLYYYYKGFGFLSELALSSQDVVLALSTGEVTNKAWQVATSYVIGADNSYGAIQPRKPLGWKKGGTGAFEFGVRYNEIHMDQDAFPVFADPNKSARKAKAFAFGFNWIINNNVKFMLDYEQTRFKGGAANGSDRPTEHLLVNRYQFAF